MKIKFLIALVLLLFNFGSAFAQTTEFTYQGKLTDTNSPPAANYDFEFRLFAVETGGTALASQQRLNVPVANGIFTVRLDFGANFPGANRFLEIAVRPAGSGSFATLAPRQPIQSAPYAARASSSAQADGLSSACAGCVSNANIGSLAGSKITGEIPVASVPAGSANYIRNSTSPQSAADFNVSGTGTASVLNATTQFNIGVDRMLAKGTASVFAGRLAGASTTTGSGNSFFGDSAGRFNVSGANNSFFGREAGTLNTAGDNSFFGAFSGDSNTTGTHNSFFGSSSGGANQTGDDNSFFGYRAGRLSTGGQNSFFGSSAGENNTSGLNSFFGYQAGALNTTGFANVFVGNTAGDANVTGSFNTAIGRGADVATGNLQFATAIGAGAVVGENNTLVLGRAVDKVKMSVLQVTGGSDLAENFEVADEAAPGMIVAIDPKRAGKLTIARGAYNRRVAGIVSGANNLSAGMILSDLKGAQKSLPVALSGRAWVYADATKTAIKPGDLLTTSATPGYAMKVLNYKRAQGAIIGKAITELKTGKGLVLVLVSLQ